MKGLWLFALCLLPLECDCAAAQSHSVSYSTWTVSGNLITVRYLLPVTEAQRLTGGGVPVLTTAKLEDYLLEHLAVQSAGGACPAIDQGFDLGRVDPLAVGPDLFGFEIFYRCTDPRQLVFRNTALFATAPRHVDFARIQIGRESSTALFTAQRQDIARLDGGVPPAPSPGLYPRLGFMHMLDGVDRWCFVLGALLLAPRSRDAGYLLLASIVGYGLAVTVSAVGWIMPREALLQASMGLLVALLGALITQREMLGAGSRGYWSSGLLLAVIVVALLRAPWAAAALLGGAAVSLALLELARGAERPPMICAGLVTTFAFLDGFGLPAVLPPARLPQWTQVQMAIGFDLGTILFDALLVGIVLGCAYLLRNVRIAALRPLLYDLSAACLSGLGAFWLVNRLG